MTKLLLAATALILTTTAASAQRITDEVVGVRSGQRAGGPGGGFYGGYGPYGYGFDPYGPGVVYVRPRPQRVYDGPPVVVYGAPYGYGYGGVSGYDPATVQGGGRTQGSDAFVPFYQRGSGQRAGGPAYQLNRGGWLY